MIHGKCFWNIKLKTFTLNQKPLTLAEVFHSFWTVRARCEVSIKMEDTQIVEDALVCTVLADCSAAVCCQEEEGKWRKHRNVWTLKFLLNRN